MIIPLLCVRGNNRVTRWFPNLSQCNSIACRKTMPSWHDALTSKRSRCGQKMILPVFTVFSSRNVNCQNGVRFCWIFVGQRQRSASALLDSSWLCALYFLTRHNGSKWQSLGMCGICGTSWHIVAHCANLKNCQVSPWGSWPAKQLGFGPKGITKNIYNIT